MPSRSAATPQLRSARLKTAATILICRRCSFGSTVRRNLKTSLKAAGRKRDLRVIACGCLDVCPKRGTATLLARSDRPARCIVIDDRTNVDVDLVGALLDEGAGNSVPDQDRSRGRVELL